MSSDNTMEDTFSLLHELKVATESNNALKVVFWKVVIRFFGLEKAFWLECGRYALDSSMRSTNQMLILANRKVCSLSFVIGLMWRANKFSWAPNIICEAVFEFIFSCNLHNLILNFISRKRTYSCFWFASCSCIFRHRKILLAQSTKQPRVNAQTSWSSLTWCWKL